MGEEETEYNLENRLKSEFDLGPNDLRIIREATLREEVSRVRLAFYYWRW